MKKPTKWMLEKVRTGKELKEKYPDCSFIPLDDFCDRASSIPYDYLFDASIEYTDYEKLFELISTKERPLNFNDGWTCSAASTSPIGTAHKVDGCNWYMLFTKRNGLTKCDEICIPMTDELCEKSEIFKVQRGILVEVEDVGYMRKGENNKFHEDMDNDKPCFVFSKDVLNEYRDNYFDGKGGRFDELICKPFGNGKGKFVHFWY